MPQTGSPNDESPARWGAAGWALAAAAFAVGFAAFPLRVVGREIDHLPGDAIDNRLNNFVLEHGYRYLTGRAGSFWNAPSFYPAARVTAWSDAHLGMLPVYAAFRAAGCTPEQAFQGWFLVPFALNFAAAGWALRRLGSGPVGGVAGAYLFAFGLPLVAQLQHAQLYPRFLVPPAVVFAWEFLRAPRTWRLAAVAGCGVGQMYLSVYIGYFLALLLAAGFAVAAVRFRHELPWDELRRPGRPTSARRVAVVLTAVLAWLPLVLGHGRGLGKPPPEQVRLMAPKPTAWVTPAEPAAAFPELSDATGLRVTVEGEQQLFAGAAALLALAAGLVVARRPVPFGDRASAVAVGAWASLLVVVFVTPVAGVWLYQPVSYLPGAGGIRAVGRVVLVLLFPAAVAVAWCADELVRAARRAGRPAAAAAGAAALAAVAADHWLTPTDGPRAGDWRGMRHPVAAVVARQARLSEAIARHPTPALVCVFTTAAAGTDPHEYLIVQLEAMRASQDLGVPCVNGWSGYLPIGWEFFHDYRGLMAWLAVKNRLPPERLVGLAVVGEPTPGDPAEDAALRAAFPPRPVR